MQGSRVILCIECGTKNRIADDKKNPLCATCGKPLFVSRPTVIPSETKLFLFKNWYIGVIALIVIGMIVIVKHHEGKPVIVDSPLVLQSKVAVTGIITQEFDKGAAPLAIKTQSGNDYYVKIIEVNTRHAVMTAYIKGGEAINAKLPLGSYEIHYAAGHTWYGLPLLFGPDTIYSKAAKQFDFKLVGRMYSGITIELLSLQNSNVQTSPLKASDF